MSQAFIAGMWVGALATSFLVIAVDIFLWTRGNTK